MSDEERDRLHAEMAEMTSIGQIAVVDWTGEEPQYLNTAFSVRGWRAAGHEAEFPWRAAKLALVGQMIPVIEVPGCEHDPCRWGREPGVVECAKGCGATWSATLTPVPEQLLP